ncbi:MAG: trypsin-like peptidase domain-containing protein [Planctomycetota bacterium]|nr:trypsin-like peptidase domain-containing protein [Planctomycetota bacterium]
MQTFATSNLRTGRDTQFAPSVFARHSLFARLYAFATLRQAIVVASIVALTLGVGGSAGAADAVVVEAQQRRIDVLKKISPAVVAIFGNGGQGGGSGVVISADGYALSNFHVTSGSGNFMKCGLNDGVLYDAVIVGIDPTGDVALIKLLGRDDFPFATIGDSDKVNVGDWAYAIGNPFLLATDFHPTVTYGIVSGVHRYQYPAGTFLEYADCIQVDSSINPGNSGGPLFNDDGELIGINGRGSFEKRGRVNSGAGYAISINQIMHFVDHLRSGRIVDHATLGATVTSDADGRVIVSSILESSEAYRRGLRMDDEIVSFAGRSIRSVNQFKNVLGIYPKGWRLPLTYRREQQKYSIMARLRGVHTKAEMMPKKKPRQPGPEQPRPGQPQPEKPDNPHGDDEPKVDNASKNAGPAEFKHMLVEKDGFANYWFNEQEQKRLMPLINRWGDFADRNGVWKVTGKSGDADDFSLTLSESGLGLQMRNDVFFQPLDGTDFLDEPPGSGGLLLAMHHLRLMLQKKAAGFSEFYYLGSEPLELTGEVVDVLVTTLTGVETRWYFARQPAGFVGLSCQITEDAEECEVYFGTVDQFGDRFFPGQIIVRSSGREYLRLTVSQVELETTP